MAADNSLQEFNALSNMFPSWVFVAFTSGSTEPTPASPSSAGDVIWGDTSDENGILEVLFLTSGVWGSGTAAGYMLLSNLSGAVGAWTSAENFTANSSTPANDGTLTLIPTVALARFVRRNNKNVLAFDADDNQVAMFEGIMPNHYGGNGITVTHKAGAATATTGDMSFKGFFMSNTSNVDDIDTRGFADPQSNAAIDAPTASGAYRDADIVFTDGAQIDNLAKGEKYFYLLMRDAQDGTNDDMAGDAQILGIEVRETA